MKKLDGHKVFVAVCLTVIAVLFGVWLWVTYGPEPRSKPGVTQSQGPALKVHKDKGKTGTVKPKGLPAQQLKGTALQVEHAMRDWGTDPVYASDWRRISMKPQEQVTPLIRGSLPAQSPLTPFLAPGFKYMKDAGPMGPNPVCKDTPNDPTCATQRTAGDWLHNQLWSYGGRVSNLKARMKGTNAVSVSGTVTGIILGTSDTMSTDDWYNLTLVTNHWDFTDTIRFDSQGKVTYIGWTGSPWWTNPWLMRWDGGYRLVSAYGTGHRTCVPVKGVPQIDLNHDNSTPVIIPCGPKAESDWKPWDDVPQPEDPLLQ